MACLLGLDIGTTSTIGIVLERTGPPLVRQSDQVGWFGE